MKNFKQQYPNRWRLISNKCHHICYDHVGVPKNLCEYLWSQLQVLFENDYFNLQYVLWMLWKYTSIIFMTSKLLLVYQYIQSREFVYGRKNRYWQKQFIVENTKFLKYLLRSIVNLRNYHNKADASKHQYFGLIVWGNVQIWKTTSKSVTLKAICTFGALFYCFCGVHT